jgi:hypothetical protein
MSTRAMVFIDGTWLAFAANRLADQHGLQGRTGGPLDFGALPRVCARDVAAQMAVTTGLDVVRTHYFGSIATNYDAVDQDAVQRRSEFFDSLRRHHRYEVYRFETDYRGHRVRRTPGDDGFSPPEKAVDVGLATALLEMAAVSAYDIAIVVCGDRDFVPALQAVRRLGKRVAIVSARGSCAREFSDPNDPMRVRDFDPLWLDALWPQVVSPAARALARATEETLRETTVESSEDAIGVPDRSTAPVSGDSPYADERMFAEQASADAVLDSPPASATGTAMTGTVTKVHANGYGFVRSEEGADYYFRRSDFTEQGEFARLERFRTRLSFRVSEPARAGQAGRAAALAITGVSDAPVVAPLRHTPSHVPAIMPGYAPPHAASSSSYAPTMATADDLWDMDPFAAPARRVAPPAPVTLDAEPVIPAELEVALVAPVAADALSPLAAGLAAAGDISEPAATVPPVIEAPRKKRVSRKSLPA